jgi:hypothetical protein
VKPNINSVELHPQLSNNSVEVHPQLSNNRHPVDDEALVGVGSLVAHFFHFGG